tara:strand:- start:1285 stop:1554 length:270 start_codon:yes stop_codon:yes gene_type:complete
MTDTKVVSWHTDSGIITAIYLNRGRKHLKMLPMGSGKLSVKGKVPFSEERYMKQLLYKGKPYPLSRAKRIFRRHGKNCGWTKAAKSALS